MTDDAYKVAHALINKHRDRARDIAQERAEEFAEHGDLNDHVFWSTVVDAIDELAPGNTVH